MDLWRETGAHQPALQMDLATLKMFENEAKAAAANRRLEKRKKHAEELKTFEATQLLQMPPIRLAEWQSEYEQDEPQWVLADQEWKRRSGISTRKIAIGAIVISALSLLVAALAYFHSLNDDSISKPEKPIAQPMTTPQLPAQSQK